MMRDNVRRGVADSSGHKVLSIVDAIERKKLDRIQEQAAELHLRDLERTLITAESTRRVAATDYEAELAKLDAYPADQTRRARARLRALRGFQRCLEGRVEEGMAEWAENVAEAPDVADTYLVRARWLTGTDNAAAIADYDRAAAADPGNVATYCRRGECYLGMGDADRALANFRRAITLDPGMFDVHHAIGKILADRGQHAEAVRAFDRAVALAPAYVDFLLARATSLIALDRWEAARADFTRVLALDDKRHAARFQRAIAELHLGHLERAHADVALVCERRPDSLESHLFLGMIRERLGLHALAVEALDRALTQKPDDRDALATRGRAHAGNGDREKALADLDRAVALGVDDVEVLLARAECFSWFGRSAEAVADAERAVALAPEDPRTYMHRGRYRYDVDPEVEGPERDFTRAVELAPEHPGYRRCRAEFLMYEGRYSDAIVDLDFAIEKAPKAGVLFYDRGRCYSLLDEEQILKLGDEWWEEDDARDERCRRALADFERAIELGHVDEDVYSDIYEVHYMLGDDDAQTAALDRGIQALPDSALLHVFRETHRRAHGDLEGAAADHARAKELGFQYPAGEM